LRLLFILCATILCPAENDILCQEEYELPDYVKADIHKDRIRRIHNDSMVSYDAVKDKVTSKKEATHLEELNNEVNEYYELAKTLEARGEYANAAKCYEKIIELTDGSNVKAFITKTNERLKSDADDEKRAAAQKVRAAEKRSKVDEEEKRRAEGNISQAKGLIIQGDEMLKRMKYEEAYEFYSRALDTFEEASSEITPEITVEPTQ